MSPIDWDDRPPTVHPARVWTCPVGEFRVRLLARPVGVWIHWLGKRSLPCLKGDCPAARHRSPQRWQGYAAAALARPRTEEVRSGPHGQYVDAVRPVLGWIAIVLPLSPEQAAELDGADPAAGVVVRVRRGKEDRTYQVAEVSTPYTGLPPLRPFDVVPILLRMWGVRADQVPELHGQGLDQGGAQAHGEPDGHFLKFPAADIASRRGKAENS